jgi:hypothetical protein
MLPFLAIRIVTVVASASRLEQQGCSAQYQNCSSMCLCCCPGDHQNLPNCCAVYLLCFGRSQKVDLQTFLVVVINALDTQISFDLYHGVFLPLKV